MDTSALAKLYHRAVVRRRRACTESALHALSPEQPSQGRAAFMFAGQQTLQVVGVSASVVILMIAKARLSHERLEALALDSKQLLPLDLVERAKPFHFLGPRQMACH